MTSENKQGAIKEELERAESSSKAAILLASKGFYSDAVSRLYYFVYHSAKALLFSEGLEPRSHEGLLRLVGQHFVKKGVLTPQDSHVLSRLMKYREEADYNPSYTFTKEDYDGLLVEASALHDKIIRYLMQQGYR